MGRVGSEPRIPTNAGEHHQYLVRVASLVQEDGDKNEVDFDLVREVLRCMHQDGHILLD